MDIKTDANLTALNGLNNGSNQLNNIAQSINNQLIQQNPANSVAGSNQANPVLPPYSPPNYSNLNTTQPATIEENIIGMTQTKTQMLSLMKVLEVEKENFDSSIGKIFDNWV